jgi:hypothetical protein
MKRAGFLLLLLLTYVQAFGEAFKNDSVGGILTAVFVLLTGVPVAIGAGVYALLHLGEQDYTASKGLTIFCSCAGWWAMLFLAFDSEAVGGAWFLGLCVSAGAAVAAYFASRRPNVDA